jgi:hypothetical protein
LAVAFASARGELLSVSAFTDHLLLHASSRAAQPSYPNAQSNRQFLWNSAGGRAFKPFFCLLLSLVTLVSRGFYAAGTSPLEPFKSGSGEKWAAEKPRCLHEALFMTAPAGTTPCSTNRHSATRSFLARATMPIRRIRPPPLNRLANHCESSECG